MFEVLATDLAGAIGRLKTGHGTVETPAFVPVVHPVSQSVPVSKMRSLGFQMFITNAYIAMRRARERAASDGIHAVIGHDGPVMTDSGGYQVLEYGRLDVLPPEMARFEEEIGTDIAVPLDKPTGLGMGREAARRSVEETLAASKEALESHPGRIWAGPVQGGSHEDLVAYSAGRLVGMGFGMLALGSPVEFMESYKYRQLASMIAAARKAAPRHVPLHLFGAGHPMTIPLAVALGCDTFDSASYMLYAKRGMYITEDGTRALSGIAEFSCPCEVCSSHTPAEMGGEGAAGRLALHNLHAIRAEVARTREALREGRLWEHVMKKGAAHPSLHEAGPVMARESAYLAEATPAFKKRAAFFVSPIDQYRPEAAAYRAAVARFRTGKKNLLVMQRTRQRPAYLSREYRALGADGNTQVCQYSPFLGPIPVELSDLYPAAHHVAASADYNPRDFETFGRAWDAFVSNNRFERIDYKDDGFIEYFVKKEGMG